MGPDSSLTPELIQAQSFTSSFRGYDAGEVKSFLGRVANELRAWRERAEGLESAWHSAEERAARPPVLDEDTLMAAVGEETATILRTARAAAAELRSKAAAESDRTLNEARAAAEQARLEAREEADRTRADAKAESDRTLTEARAEAARLQSEAESAMAAATTDAEEAASQLLAAARADAAEMVSRANAEAEEIRAAADKERQLTVEGANTTRDRILEDLSRRRRVAAVQIEQLRAGRERLIESYAIVRRTLEEVQSELSRADAEARAAADEVGRRLQRAPEPGPAGEGDVLTGTAPPDRSEAAPTSRSAGEGTDGADADGGAGSDQDALPPSSIEGHTGEAEPSASAVDELFARIRATRGADEPPGPGAEGEESTESGTAPLAADDGMPGEPPTTETPVVGAGTVETEPAPVPAFPTGPAVSASPAGGPEPEPVDEGSAGDRPAPEAATGRRPRKRSTRAERTTPANGHARPPRSNVTVIEPAEEAPQAEVPGPVVEAVPAPAVVAPEIEAPADDAPVPDGDEALLQARELAIVDLETTLTRRLKRALQDEQNDVLDRLRNLKQAPTPDRLLPDLERQTARYTDAARPLLGEAATAGAVFADEILGRPGRDEPVRIDVADLAAECGSGLMTPLRRRLEQAIEAGGSEDQSVLVDALGAAYREWKTQRIERLAGDALAAAFSRGTWKAAPDAALFRWVVEDVDGPCPDCDDDALAGSIPKGEEFPTGQHHPPAHSGCRCLLVPARPGS